jgi:hypothetical protein
MAKAKDWYWEAEQEKIAADPNLLLIRGPDEGLPTEGLECVGLCFLMLNQMSRSSRKGYLSSVQNPALPMTTEQLAVLTGRSVEVTARVLAVVMEWDFFSLSADGFIYSRGMVRKEELRKKRALAGRKGGLRSQEILLKQVVEQQVEQSVRIKDKSSSKEEITNPPDFSPRVGGCKGEGNLLEQNSSKTPSVATLTAVWRDNVSGREPESEKVCNKTFQDMLGEGIPGDAILAEMSKRLPNEWLTKFWDRLRENFATKPGSRRQYAPDEQLLKEMHAKLGDNHAE